MIKIMHIVVSFDTGGMENGIVNLANNLSAEEFETSICCLEKSGKAAARLPKNVTVFELNKSPGVSFSTPGKLARLIKQVQPHLIHTHGLGPLIYGAAATFVGLSVPILHGEHRQLYGHDLTRRSMVIRKMLYRRCARIHTVSESVKQNLAGFGFDFSRVTAIRNGVDCEKFRPGDKAAAKSLFNLSPDTLVLGVVSRIRPEKNINLLVAAFAELSGTFSGIKLLIIGDGPAMSELRSQIAELSVADAVVLAGHRDDTPLCYNAMDLMVLPSSAEGMSNAVLEAMACGVPVVVSDVCGSSEVVTHGHDGLLVNTVDQNTLIKTITEAISDVDLLKVMGENARKTVFEKFSLDRMVAQYKQVYQEFLPFS